LRTGQAANDGGESFLLCEKGHKKAYICIAMSAARIREILHDYINTADENLLAAIYTLLEPKIEPENIYDKETLDMLYKRRENHLRGISKSYTVEESMQMLRQRK
jgi:hypothetical protein